MAVSRRRFLMLGAEQLNPYAGPGKSVVADVPLAEEIAGEKRHAPVPVGAGTLSAFRLKCVGCLKCVGACPRGLLHPSSNIAHLGRPELRFRTGWCRPECNRCAEACPSRAIKVLADAESKMRCHPNVAIWHSDRCVAAAGTDVCHACERHCPAKAVTLVAKPGAEKDAPRVPHVDVEKCIGCGACEHYCPARPKAAMSVEGRA